jgi:hypothetical protein
VLLVTIAIAPVSFAVMFPLFFCGDGDAGRGQWRGVPTGAAAVPA